MKKLISLIIVIGFAAAMVSCDGGKKAAEAAAKATADSLVVVDSLAKVQADADAAAALVAEAAKMAADSVAKADSVAQTLVKKK